MNGSEAVSKGKISKLLSNYFFNCGQFAYFCRRKTVAIAQLVRASDCGSEGRGFEPHWPPSPTPDISLEGSGVFN